MKVAVSYKGLNDGETPYDEALRGVGLDPMPFTPDKHGSMSDVRGLVLTGGGDIDPKLYKESNSDSKNIDGTRDQLEIECLDQALKLDLPVLAICRGAQLLNVFHGGSLIQHLPSSDVHQQRCRGCERGRHPAAHSVSVAAGTKLAGVIGEGEHQVNSRHHQAAGRVGVRLVVSAKSIDGVIEGLERPDRTFVVGVQWHPEDRVLVSEADRRLFEAFRRAISD